MTNSDIIEPKEEGNILPFRFPALPGGKGPTGGWLAGLEIGSIFLCRHKKELGVQLVEYFLQHLTDKSALLQQNTEQGRATSWVDLKRFSENFELFEVLKVLSAKQEEETNDDEEHSDRPNQRGGLVLDEDPESGP